jgi:hypothetical protein
MNVELSAELAASAARLVVEEGLEYAAAKRKAARELGALRGGARAELPSNEAVEDAVREHIALFCADTQPAELAVLRALARAWMERLAEFRPHLSGAVWRGTATRLSAIHIDLYADDPKAPEIALINQGIDYDTAEVGAGRRGEPLSVLSLATHCAEWNERVTVHLTVRDHDDLRGALLRDAAGRSWRGDARALQRMIEDQR